MNRRRTRPADERLRRLLVMLPWLMEHESVPLADVAARFGLTTDEVAADLELASMCGLPPYVDELIDVFIDDGMVHVGVPRLFTRPLRLNSREAFELLTSARAAMELPGADPAGPLGRGLAKLAATLGHDAEADAGGVVVELERPAVADDLVDAAARGEALDIEYWSAARDETSVRRVVPRQVFADRGNWYLLADDDRSGAVRTFRVDRVLSISRTGEMRSPVGDALPRPGEWFVDGSVPRAVLRLAPSARWIVERYPVDDVGAPDADGRIEVTLPVASERWFERLVLRLGADVEVLAPDDLRGVAAEAAARVLAIYRAERTADAT